MGEMHETITARIICEAKGVKPDALRMRFAKLRKANPDIFASPWRIDSPLSPAQVSLLLQAGAKEKPMANANNETAGRLPKAAAAAVISAAKNAANYRRFPLWLTLAITAGASVPNMLEVTMAMKGNSVSAWAIIAAFTVAPFLLIMSRAKSLAVVIGAMGYTAFCNAAAIFGGLTGMDKGYIMQPTVFLEAVTNMANTDYLNTARFLSGIMAVLIGAIEFTAFKNLSK